MRIAILTPSLTSGDAVSNDVMGMYQALQPIGDLRLFAEGWTVTEPRILPADKIRSFLKKPNDILIYHYSRGWDSAMELLTELPCQKVIKYHNITPPEFVARYNRDYATMCDDGRRQLQPIAQSNCDYYLSDSAYNMCELVTAGAAESKSFVVPPFHHIDRLHSIEPDSLVLDKYRNGAVNICTVGRIVPNKGHAKLIAAFAAYHHDYNRKSRLVIIGKEETRLGSYSALLRELVRRLDIEDAVSFAGEVSDHALKSYYLAADVFMTTSEHEGFCVPLVEAMAMEVPIVAFASSAIPETIGPAGIVWSERNPYLLAESIDSIARDEALSKSLSALGWRRYQELFTNDRIRREFLKVLAAIL